MAQFLSELKSSKECLDHCTKENVRRWKLEEPLIYESDYLNYPLYLHTGFSCDKASYPGREAEAPAFLHDFLYSSHFLYRAKFSYNGIMGEYLASSDWLINQQIILEKVKVSKLKADRIFYEAMKVSGDPPSKFRRWAMWQAVIWLGFPSWIRGGRKKI